ncbi:putative membrane protein [Natronospira proteinivora]|uniref:Membrane protein n=1 Tax=Natronospira proteinivora TaxID=1807133 RepID=A0ABT1G9J2_9GAMM|nr:DUF502 domain-containing protein [Natronospira proteinivora]MCP1727986.1 putative membrane protein [Natronospira proteinivora]
MRSLLKSLGRHFLLGLITLLPLGLILYVLALFLRAAESIMGGLLADWLPPGWYWPGMGLLSGLLLILLAGVLAASWVGPLMGRWVGRRVSRLPLLGRVYTTLHRFFSRLGSDTPAGFREVVFVPLQEGGGRIGLIVDRQPLRYGADGRALVPVYFPKPFQPGGDFELVPADRLEHCKLSVDEALGLVLTGGLARD